MEKVYFKGKPINIGDSILWVDGNYLVRGKVCFGQFMFYEVSVLGYYVTVERILQDGVVLEDSEKQKLLRSGVIAYSLLQILRTNKSCIEITEVAEVKYTDNVEEAAEARKYMKKLAHEFDIYKLMEIINSITDLNVAKEIIKCCLDSRL